MRSKNKDLVTKNLNKSPKIKSDLIEDLRQLIEKTRQSVAFAINSSLTVLYWKIGHRIRSEILQDKRADYGKEIVATLMRQLSWSHFIELIPIKDALKRDFYAEMCRIEKSSVLG
ncbi:DUF1016 N-terminal domain-containing protein [Parachlamydia acanthamoebae]|jgi:hypothetical protein|uniref:DUF1016 N-terminal domain-containing protein n=1 Tax=Parachlamydia acanthamoebae TaxID=83552 RepID=UPI0001C17873|nr:DUF1016 N-terminal domain-containing protein [Parachlamydia acanthamoebae]EFB42100.1 hypothetical protein pah_c015o008 [Parachlamydia acanthamoebae str. Hall's coccus]